MIASEILKSRVIKILEKVPSYIKICAAAKARKPWEIDIAIQSGISLIGMNYVQETKQIQSSIKNITSWSFLGKIQTNKIATITKLFDVVESVDDLDKLVLLNQYCKKLKKKIRILIEINIANEPQKEGILPEYLDDFLFQIEGFNFNHVYIDGLMTMGPPNMSTKQYEKLFQKMYLLFQKKKSWSTLSMGMSDTWEIAVSCGATQIRIGSLLFGKKDFLNATNPII